MYLQMSFGPAVDAAIVELSVATEAAESTVIDMAIAHFALEHYAVHLSPDTRQRLWKLRRRYEQTNRNLLNWRQLRLIEQPA